MWAKACSDLVKGSAVEPPAGPGLGTRSPKLTILAAPSVEQHRSGTVAAALTCDARAYPKECVTPA